MAEDGVSGMTLENPTSSSGVEADYDDELD